MRRYNVSMISADYKTLKSSDNAGWKAAHSSEHVKIGMFPNSELLKNMEEVLQSLDCSCLDILGHPEEHMLMVDRYLDSALSNVYKSKIQPKNEKNYQIKYIPKQRNGMLER